MSDALSPAAVANDTPVSRATVNMLTVIEMEALLDGVRQRRLVLRLKLEEIAKTKVEKDNLSLFMKFEAAVLRTRTLFAKSDEQEEKMLAAINKLRALAMEME